MEFTVSPSVLNFTPPSIFSCRKNSMSALCHSSKHLGFLGSFTPKSLCRQQATQKMNFTTSLSMRCCTTTTAICWLCFSAKGFVLLIGGTRALSYCKG